MACEMQPYFCPTWNFGDVLISIEIAISLNSLNSSSLAFRLRNLIVISL